MNDHQHQPIIEEIDLADYDDSNYSRTVLIYACTICGETMEGDPEEDRAEVMAEMAYDEWKENQA